MNQSYKKYSFYLLLSLILTLVGTFIGGYVSVETIGATIVVSFVLIFAFLLTKGKVKKVFFYIFCLGEGITLTPIIWYYTKTDIMGCLLLTFLIVALFLIIGLKVKNLGFLKGILLISLLGLVLYQVVGLFFPLPSLALLGVIIFCGYIAYDINKFKLLVNEHGDLADEEILNEVMDMYLDIINIFLYLLRLFGGSDD